VKPNSNFILPDDGWQQERLRGWIQLLKREMLGGSEVLSAVISTDRDKVVSFVDREALSYASVREGDRWGETWQSAWLRLEGRVPESWKGEKVFAELSFNNESTVYASNGEPAQRLTEYSIYDAWYCVDTYPLFDACEGGENVELWIQTFANGINGVSRDEDPLPDDRSQNGHHEGVVKKLRLRTVRPEVRALYFEAETLFSLVQVLPEYSVRRARILRSLMNAVSAYRDDVEYAGAARGCLVRELSRPASGSSLKARAIGHAHIDTGWLWRIEDGARKCERTFASQLQLIERYPHYVFGASSAQHYAFIQQTCPEMFKGITRQIADRRWEIQGAMWVESDTMLPSGESLIRQFVYGKRYFKREFGIDVRHAWLPDVFGLTASFPQIMRQAGVDCLVTKKPHWNRKNLFPHTTFCWAGQDGSEVLVHILPQDRDYNGKMQADDLVRAEQGLVEKDRLDEFLYTYGVGDGGGGPTDLMVERAPYLQNLEGVPNVEFGSIEGALDHFREHKADLELWTGEIYFEGHRGTYTSQADIKRDNRRLERELRQIELLYTTLPAELYPRQELHEMWKALLLHQFHDILPGSGIREVYEDSRKSFDQCFATSLRLIQAYVERLEPSIDRLIVFNPSESAVLRPMPVPEAWRGYDLETDRGQPVPRQDEPEGTYICPSLGPLGFIRLKRGAACPSGVRESSALVLENDFVRYVFERDGSIVSILDRQSGLEYLSEGEKGNVFSLYVDRPICWDAWDVDHLYQDELSDRPVAVAEPSGWAGPVRQVLRFSLKVGKSTITQTCVLAAHSRRLDFDTEVDWRERHRMLRVAFHTNIKSGFARYDIQHGFIDRPTHHNTSWEAAKFEAPALRYVSLHDGQRGLALLNNGKYGHKVLHSTIDLNLLRAPTFPDHSADQGMHHFTYAIVPFSGAFAESPVLAEASSLNNPPLVFPGRGEGKQLPFAITGDGVSVEAMKRAEEGNDLVLRIAECLGKPTNVEITCVAAAQMVQEVNVLEEPLGESRAVVGGLVPLTLRPFEVKTLRFSQ